MRTPAILFTALVLSAIPNAVGAQPIGGAQPAPAGEQAPSSAPSSDTVITNQVMFNIPFSLDPSAAQPVEVRLFVSADQGANWNFYTRARPADGNFLFRARGDGQYWFAVRTVDQNLRLRPEGPLRPELQVVVDTKRPQIQLNAQAGPAGQITTSWRTLDDHLVADSFRLQYQALSIHAGSAAPWRDIAVEVPRDGAPPATTSGEITWWPESAAQALNVRAQVRDQAGNVAVVNQRVSMPRVAWDRRPQQPPPVKPAPQIPADPFATSEPAQPSPPTDTPWAPDNENGSPASAETVDRRHDQTPQNVAENPAAIRPGKQATNVSQSRSAHGPAIRQPVALPAGADPHWTNSRRLNLNYDVESVDPTGVARVELWVTQDGGQSWTSAGTDPDRKSPFTIEVNADGVYGFRIVITSNGGLAGSAPQSGDSADLWIGVDSETPTAEIISAPFGVEDQTGHLTINWQANDAQLGPRPITLLYSDQSEGPWKSIAEELPNTGQHHWRVAAGIPEQVYLRLEVRDLAGNVQSDQLSRPINLAGLRPKARIRGFEPAGNSNRQAATPQSLQ